MSRYRVYAISAPDTTTNIAFDSRFLQKNFGLGLAVLAAVQINY
jgi:hypothetical protein